MQPLEGISVDPAVRFGKACVRGTRLTVGEVLEFLASGRSEQELLADFLRDDPSLSALLDMFNVTTERHPLADDLTPDDPRSQLTWFPRPGDHLDIDAANPGLGGTRFTHGSGPVFRMVIALGPEGVEGQNILPGGQSGLTDSPFFCDQARDWLANTTSPMRYTPAEVVAGAVGRERYAPGL